MILDAVSKLMEALSINPSKHEALWCLGNAHTATAFLTPDHDEANIMFNQALISFQTALELVRFYNSFSFLFFLSTSPKQFSLVSFQSPANEHYLQSLASCAKVLLSLFFLYFFLTHSSQIFDDYCLFSGT